MKVFEVCLGFPLFLTDFLLLTAGVEREEEEEEEEEEERVLRGGEMTRKPAHCWYDLGPKNVHKHMELSIYVY